MLRLFASLAIVATLSGCANMGGSAAIKDISADKVVVQVTSLNKDDTPAYAEAVKACNQYNKRVSPVLSTKCLDNYCISRDYLFACR